MDVPRAIHDPRGFLEKYPPPVIIDEIQHAPELLSYIKAIIDRDRKPGQWILTGSQAFPLMRNVSESLAGRVAILTLYPFSLSEMNRNLRRDLKTAPAFIRHLNTAQKPLKRTLSCGEWLLRGGYPEIFTGKKVSMKLWFSSYLQSYIDRDVRGNIKTANLNEFERFVKLLASRTAQELNYSTLAGDVGVTVPTIKSWVSFLEASSLIHLLYPYIKRFSAFLDPASLYFWRSVDGFEVDLLVEVSNKIFPIEFKLSSTITDPHTSSLRAWLKLVGDKNSGGMIVSTSEQMGLAGHNVHNCHFSLL